MCLHAILTLHSIRIFSQMQAERLPESDRLQQAAAKLLATHSSAAHAQGKQLMQCP